jgi:PPP family 3-phenylpropionic acid transporter
MFARLSQPLRRDLWLARAYYFTFMGGWGFILPFINLYYVSLGLSGKQIGVFASTSAVVGLVAAPLWLTEARKRPNPRLFLQMALAASALAYLLISQQTVFLPIVAILFFQALASTGVLPMSDTLAVSVSQAAGTGYGSVRVWASLGWILAVLSSGWLIEHFGYQTGFGSASLALTLGAGLLFFIRPHNFKPYQTTAGEPPPSLHLAARRVFENRLLLAFALALGLITFLNSGVLQFENVFLAQLGATKSLISIAGVLSALVELPFMLLSDRILRRYGAERLMLTALAMNLGLRLFIFAFPVIPAILIVRFVGGVSFSLYTVSFIGLVSENTSPVERGTVLALYTATLAGLVNIVAAPVAGAAFDAFGARWLYIFSAFGYLGAFLSLWLARSRSQPVVA